jgi:hypothetical protein
MQTAVKDNPVLGSPGDLADLYTGTEGDIVSAVNTESEDPILFGTMVKRGSTARTVLNMADSHDKPFGIATRAHAFSSPSQIDAIEVDEGVEFDGLMPGTLFGVGREGRYVVIIEANVSLTDEVHVRCAADPGEILGAFSPSDLGDDGLDCTAYAEWVEAGTVDETGFGVAVVEVHMGLASLTVTDS